MDIKNENVKSIEDIISSKELPQKTNPQDEQAYWDNFVKNHPIKKGHTGHQKDTESIQDLEPIARDSTPQVLLFSIVLLVTIFMLIYAFKKIKSASKTWQNANLCAFTWAVISSLYIFFKEPDLDLVRILVATVLIPLIGLFLYQIFLVINKNK